MSTAFLVSVAVFFVGGVPASIVSGAATSLSCLAPPGAVGPAVITVTTPTGCFTTAVYTYQ